MSINQHKSELIQDWYFNSRALNILDHCTRSLKFEDLAKPNSFLNGPKFFFEPLHIGGETFYSLLVTFYLLLVTFYSLLVTRCFLLVTCYFLLATCYFLFLTFPSLLIAAYLILVATYSISLLFIGTILHYVCNNHIKLYVSSWRYRSSHQRCSLQKDVLNNIAKVTGKHLCSLRLATLWKKILWYRCFPVNFSKFLRTPFW